MTGRPWVRGELRWLRSGPLYRVHRSAEPLLDEVLARNGYQRIELDGRSMTGRLAAHAELARAFDFPDWCGPNWDAVNDCLGDFVHRYDGQLVAIVLHDLDIAARAAPATAGEVVWALLQLAFGQLPSLPPSVTWRIDLDVFATGGGTDFDRPAAAAGA